MTDSLLEDAPRCQECGGERGWFGPCPTCGADAPRASGSLFTDVRRRLTELSLGAVNVDKTDKARDSDEDCCWITDPCPIHNPEPRAWSDADNPGASYGGQP